MAGINAHLKNNNKDEFILKRDEAYIGVLIDDLINKGVDEPYRMFTSRAEYRILLRQDNSDFRLTERAYDIGLVTEERKDLFLEKKKYVEELKSFLNKNSIKPEEINAYLEQIQNPKIKQKERLAKLLLRPQIKLKDLEKYSESLQEYIKSIPNRRDEILDSVEIQIKYENYIEREKQSAEKLKRLEYVTIPENFKFEKLQSLSTEAVQKLKTIRPKNIGQASRIPGVSPADISALLVYFGR